MKIFNLSLILFEAVCVSLWLGAGYQTPLILLTWYMVVNFAFCTLMFLFFIARPMKLDGLGQFSKTYVALTYVWSIVLIIALAYGNELMLTVLVAISAVRDAFLRAFYWHKFGSTLK